jgi:hypothetical protein
MVPGAAQSPHSSPTELWVNVVNCPQVQGGSPQGRGHFLLVKRWSLGEDVGYGW